MLFQQEIAKARGKATVPATSTSSGGKTGKKSNAGENDSDSSDDDDDDEDDDVVGPLPPKILQSDEQNTK